MLEHQIIVEQHGKRMKAQWSEEVARELQENHGVDIEQELANILTLEIDRELHAQRLGIDSTLVTDEMARTEKDLRILDAVRQLREFQATEGKTD